MDGAVHFIGSVGTVDVTIAVSSGVDALTVGATPFRLGMAAFNQRFSFVFFCFV